MSGRNPSPWLPEQRGVCSGRCWGFRILTASLENMFLRQIDVNVRCRHSEGRGVSLCVHHSLPSTRPGGTFASHVSGWMAQEVESLENSVKLFLPCCLICPDGQHELLAAPLGSTSDAAGASKTETGEGLQRGLSGFLWAPSPLPSSRASPGRRLPATTDLPPDPSIAVPSPQPRPESEGLPLLSAR